MGDVSFTAGITFTDDRVSTVDVTGIDGTGIAYTSEEGPVVVPWSEVKAVMLATTDHMLESAGSLFSMAEAIQETAETGPRDAAELRRFGIRLLQQAAPRLCPLGAACGLGPPSPAPGPDDPDGPDGPDDPDGPDPEQAPQ